MITQTFEPIRPIYLKDDGSAGYHNALGTGRVFYGAADWPSRSYAIFDGHTAFELTSRADESPEREYLLDRNEPDPED